MSRLDIKKLSKQFSVRRLNKEDIPLIQSVMSGNTVYYEYCGHQSTTDDIIRDMRVTPPGKTIEDKYYVGFFDRQALAAVMDLIDGYPSEEIAYIGFFMLNATYQGKGLGSAMIEELCACLKDMGFVQIQLGYEKANPQSSYFWQKNGFAATEEICMDGGIIVRAALNLT